MGKENPDALRQLAVELSPLDLQLKVAMPEKVNFLCSGYGHQITNQSRAVEGGERRTPMLSQAGLEDATMGVDSTSKKIFNVNACGGEFSLARDAHRRCKLI